MNVIKVNPIPVYEATCPECESVIEYIASEVSFTGYITCPVCGMPVWASNMLPKRYTDAEKIGDGYYIEWGNTNKAEPVKRGKWIYNSPDTVKCDQCGLIIKDKDQYRLELCPNCRAKMGNEE